MNCKICDKSINYGQEYCARCFDVYKVSTSYNRPLINKATAESKSDKKFYQIDSDQIAAIREALTYITWNWNRLKEVEAILNDLKEIPLYHFHIGADFTEGYTAIKEKQIPDELGAKEQIEKLCAEISNLKELVNDLYKLDNQKGELLNDLRNFVGYTSMIRNAAYDPNNKGSG